jgi:hypothetical protein
MADALVISDKQMRTLDAGSDKAVVHCTKPPVKVAIELAQPVACPGHRLYVKAQGTPSGGTYAWTVSNGKLVDGSGKPKDTGEGLYLSSFEPDNTKGRIPELKAKVEVKYTHPDGTASDSKEVTVHSVDFDVTGLTVRRTDLEAKPSGIANSSIESKEGDPTMDVNPTVTIRLGSCSRKSECAQSYRVGWIQDITKWEKTMRYRYHLVQLRPKEGPPIRDAVEGAEKPFYAETYSFQKDGDWYKVNHSDTPSFGALLEDKRHTKPADSPLEQIGYKLDFTAWLAGQNTEVSGGDPESGLLYLRNFDWSVDCTVKVTTDPLAAPRFEPRVFTPTIGPVGTGQGARTPSFTKTTANETAEPKVTDLRPPPRHR